MKKILALLLTASLCLSLAACGGKNSESGGGSAGGTSGGNSANGSADAITLRIAENQAADSHLAMAMQKFEELVEERSEGSIQIEVYLNGELGDEDETIEQVDAGVIDMARVDGSVLVPYVPELEVFTLPYIFGNDAHKWAAFEGEPGQKVSDLLLEAGFVNLGFLESGWRSFYSAKEITGLSSLRGLKIRVQNSQVYIKMMDLFGANATPMGFSEVFTSLQTGVIDAAENDPVSFLTSGHYEVAKYFLMDEHSADINLFVMSRAIYDSLTEAQQSLLTECARDAIEWEKEYALGLQADARASAEEAGVTFIEADKSEFQAAVEPIYEMYSQYSELIESVRALQ